jgi:hypothetical protein
MNNPEWEDEEGDGSLFAGKCPETWMPNVFSEERDTVVGRRYERVALVELPERMKADDAFEWAEEIQPEPLDEWYEDDEPEMVTDGGHVGVECDVDGCNTNVVGLEDGWEFDRGTVCQECIDYHDRHGHWPDEDAEICVECRIDDGAINHDCGEFSGDGVLLQPGDTCEFCGFEAAEVDADV